MLETGYPRTDVFHAPDRERARRRGHGAPRPGPGRKRVVLYAPTMRDDHRYSGNRYSLDMRLDLAAARRELADDHVLLVRRHAKVVDSVPGVDGSFALDVSVVAGRQRAAAGDRHPDQRLLVADVRLRGDRPADAVLHLRPGGLPRPAARLLLRPGPPARARTCRRRPR